MDVGDAQPGTVVGCPGCQVKIRIPTGKTGKHPAIGGGGTGTTPAPAPAPQVAPARASATGSSSRVRRRAGSGTTTKTRTATRLRGRGGDRGGRGDEGDEGDSRYAPPEKKSKTGLIVGIVVGAVVLVGLIIIIVVSSGKKNLPPPTADRSHDNAQAKVPVMNPVPNPSPNPSPNVNPDVNAKPAEGEGEDKLREKLHGGGAKGKARWDLIMDGLKMHGSKGYDSGFYEFEQEVDPSCTQAWNNVKRMGTSAYPYLLVYLMDEDPARSRGAAAALWTLAQKPGKYPRPNTAAAMQQELKTLLQVSDDAIKAAEAELKASGG
jgi:hypothetical protein